METVKVSPKYQVVIPKSIRKVLKIKPGEQMVIVEKDGIVRLIPIGDIRKTRGLARGLSTKGLRDESERFD
ncbi:MAG: AbrB/MazE/SpoVT family DNA-binding domain-containing protein [Methanobacteriota archaeon]|nr:MAG: AbrB/MazE/SpoVT family DNA-binding domain-containing protein [Euryarchaeota archaeon]